MRLIEANGTELHVADEGPRDGAPLVFANSLGTDLRVWDALLPHLPAGLRLVRYDKRGHGLSGAPEGPYSIETLADDAAALIEVLGARGAVFVGLSIGGMIGQALATRRPDLLRALVISNSAARIGDAAMWRDRIARIRAEGLDSIAAPTMERWFSPAFRATPDCALWRRMLARQPAAGYIACCEAIAAADLTDQARGLKLPVQLIAGELDGSTSPEAVRETAALLGDARYAQITGAGHLPCVEAAPRYAAILTGFLKEIGHV